MEETAALLSSTATKQRLAGVTGLLEQLRKQDVPLESSTELLPHVIHCLRGHNSKIALGSLEILEILVSKSPESTLRLYLKLLWTSLVERLGDSKLQVREKAVDVIVELSVVLDVNMVLDNLKGCMNHKNWRTREQSLHATWRCLEKHDLFKAQQENLFDDVLKLLEDSSKDVRDAAIKALEKFYTFIGSSLLSDMEYKNIRPAHMKMLTERFERLRGASMILSRDAVRVRLLYVNNKIMESRKLTIDDLQSQPYNGAPESINVQSDQLSSILSAYDLQVSASSTSMARYLESVRSRTQNDAKAAVAEGERSPSQTSSSKSFNDHHSSKRTIEKKGNDVTEKELQKQLSVVCEKLKLENKWDQRVGGLKILQRLASRCSKASNSEVALSVLSQGIRTVRELLCQQVSDLRSSVSREACDTIQTLAKSLRDEFNAHAEFCLDSLLKATYVTIQVISTSADSTIKCMIESTSNGYSRVIPKLIECVKSRNQVLRCNAVCYLTLILKKWSFNFLSKHSAMFVPIMPAILQDALGDVRSQSRKCYWALHHLFPNEARNIFSGLDRLTQKNLLDDPSKNTAMITRHLDESLTTASLTHNTDIDRFALRKNAIQPATSIPGAVDLTAEEPTTEKLPRRVLEGSSLSIGAELVEEVPRMIPQGPLRVGLVGRAKSSDLQDNPESTNQTTTRTSTIGPLRIRSAPKSSPSIDSTTESLYTSRQGPSNAGYHTSSQHHSLKAQRVQLAADSQLPQQAENNEGNNGPKRLPLASMPSPPISNASSPRSNKSTIEARNIPQRILPASESEGSKAASLPVTDILEDALRTLESKSWSTRLEAAEYIGTYIQQRVQQIESGGSRDHKLDDRITVAFIKHLNDAHYRVSQGVLKNLLSLLKLSHHTQRLPSHLKSVLPKLFQKFVDTKESIRVVAKENLDYIAMTVDNSTLAAITISILGDGSNMKVKAAMCHYLRELLPGAGGYMKHGTNSSHMRTFLLKIALLMDADVPVSVSSACGELVSVVAQLYGSELNEALGFLSPSKRLVVSKLLHSKNIVLKPTLVQRPQLVASTNSHSTRPYDDDNDNQDMETEDFRPERSRKRAESPSVTISSPARRNNQKRINTTPKDIASQNGENQKMELAQPKSFATAPQINSMNVKVISTQSVPFRTALPARFTVDTHAASLEEILHALEQNNLSETEIKHALYKTLHCIEIESPETWDRCFGRLLLLLVDAATENNIYALKVLQHLVKAQPTRAQMFFELLLQRLIDAIVHQIDVARHLMERILHDLVSQTSDPNLTLLMLIQLDSDREPPTLQVVLRLIKVCLQACERDTFDLSKFLHNNDGTDSLLRMLVRRLGHASSSVRKNAVDCLVAFHFAANDKSHILSKYLATALDDTQLRLVEIFIDRARMERHHIDLSL
ncbi:putative armadillo-like helical, CLASP domain, TOG domain-containing protein [Plasmopara halstedii]